MGASWAWIRGCGLDVVTALLESARRHVKFARDVGNALGARGSRADELRSAQRRSRALCAWAVLLHKREEQHAGEVRRGGSVEGGRKTVMFHHVADDQGPHRSGDKADEVVDRERRVGQLR